jgi:ABC-type branched-subunit amino acid transport system substrate-binding protein
MDSESLWQTAHQAANGVYAASAVDPSATTERYLSFRERFHRRWGVYPGYGASQGYECVMLLVDAGRESGSADPLVVVTTLRSYEWPGLFGKYKFTRAGDIEGRTITIKRMENGVFTGAPAINEEPSNKEE